MSDSPMPDDYDPVEGARKFLGIVPDTDGLPEGMDRLEEVVHPVAEEIMAAFDQMPLNAQLSDVELRLSGCCSELVAVRLFGTLFAGLSQEHYIAMMMSWQCGYLVAQQVAQGTLILPEA